MSNSFVIKRGDTARTLEITIQFGSDPVDLSNVTSALVFFKRGADVIQRSMTIDDDPTTGILRYQFRYLDWNRGFNPDAILFEVGKYSMEIELTYSGGAVLTSPSAGYAALVVEQDIVPTGDEL